MIRPELPKTFVLPCPKCGKENTFVFSEVEKQLKPRISVIADCGCDFPPDEILKQLTEDVRRRYLLREGKKSGT